MPGPGRSGDLTLEWDHANHDAVVEQIQRLLDQGTSLYRISPDRRGRTKLVPLRGVSDIMERRLVLKAIDLDRIMVANMSRFLGDLPK